MSWSALGDWSLARRCHRDRAHGLGSAFERGDRAGICTPSVQWEAARRHPCNRMRLRSSAFDANAETPVRCWAYARVATATSLVACRALTHVGDVEYWWRCSAPLLLAGVAFAAWQPLSSRQPDGHRSMPTLSARYPDSACLTSMGAQVGRTRQSKVASTSAASLGDAEGLPELKATLSSRRDRSGHCTRGAHERRLARRTPA